MNDADRARLAEQYADTANLNARIRLHETYEIADRDWWPWVFDHFDCLPADADLVEIGCGTGKLWRDNMERIPANWTLLLTDLSAGMAADAQRTLTESGVGSDACTATAESLPLPNDSVDAVVANHMLYHTDRDVTLPEIRRVLRPDGQLLATTNGESNMLELRELRDEVLKYEPSDAGEFTLENGPEQLVRYFDTVDRYERESTLRVPDLEPLVAHTASLPGVDEDEVAAFADIVDERIADGPLEIRKSMGLLIAEVGSTGDDEER